MRAPRPLRRLAAVLLVALVGCGGDDDGTRTGSGPDAGSASSSTTVVAGGGGTAPSPPSAASGGSNDGSDTTLAPGGAGSPATSPPAPLRPGGVGDLAAALLQPGNGDRIVVEVRAQSGAEPASATVDHLVAVLRDASGKTVVVDGVDGLGGSARAWSSGSLTSLADQAADHGQGGTQVVLRLLFLHGTFGGDDGVLGVAVRGDVAAIFSDQVDSAAGLLVAPGVVEDAVSVHELGHLLGLVDLAIDTARDDPDHPGHSTNRHSVMYWAVESDLIGQLLDGGIPNDFDAQDRADLARIRRG